VILEARVEPLSVMRPAPQTEADRKPWLDPKPWAESVHNPKNRAKTGLEWLKSVPIDEGKK
jgi:hypothetical protein